MALGTPTPASKPPAGITVQVTSGGLSFDSKSGWVKWKGTIPLCWLPAELRGREFVVHESVIAIGFASVHQFTIIDFAPMLDFLRESGHLL
jgi:hypothetical protein